MDLLFLLTIGDNVKLNTRNRLKLIRDFELLIDYEEKDNYYNNFILNKNEDCLFNQFVKIKGVKGQVKGGVKGKVKGGVKGEVKGLVKGVVLERSGSIIVCIMV